MVLKPEKEKQAEAIFKKWGLDFAIVGYTTPTDAFRRQATAGKVMADLPIKELEATRRRCMIARTCRRRLLPVVHARDVAQPMSMADTLEKLIGDAGIVLEALGVGAIRPRHSAATPCSAPAATPAVVRIEDGPKGLAMSVRRDAALLRGRSGMKAASRPSPKPGATSRPSAAGRWRSPTISTSAIPSGRRSWASWSAA